MFYESSKRDRFLAHDPFKAIVAPRPIGWISTISSQGVPNLAPYSFFNGVCSRPNLVMFSSDGEKDTVTNARQTGEFVANYASTGFAEFVNATSIDAPAEINEFEHADLEMAPCRLVAPPRVAGTAAALECKVTQIVELTDADGKPAGSTMVVGQVIGVHIDDAMIRDGRFDVSLARPITRLGYFDYEGPEGYFEMIRPKWQGPGKR